MLSPWTFRRAPRSRCGKRPGVSSIRDRRVSRNLAIAGLFVSPAVPLFFIFASRCEPGERFAYVCTACGLLSGVPHYAKALAARHLNLGCVCIPRNLGVWWPGEERSRSLMKGGKRRPSAESCLLNGVPGWPLPLLDFYCSRSSRK